MPVLKSNFTVKKTKPRHNPTRSTLNLSADQIQADLGPQCKNVDIRIANKRIQFDPIHGEWNTADAENVGNVASSNTAKKVQKDIDLLQEENNMLKLKIEVLLNLIGESIAELSTAH